MTAGHPMEHLTRYDPRTLLADPSMHHSLSYATTNLGMPTEGTIVLSVAKRSDGNDWLKASISSDNGELKGRYIVPPLPQHILLGSLQRNRLMLVTGEADRNPKPFDFTAHHLQQYKDPVLLMVEAPDKVHVTTAGYDIAKQALNAQFKRLGGDWTPDERMRYAEVLATELNDQHTNMMLLCLDVTLASMRYPIDIAPDKRGMWRRRFTEFIDANTGAIFEALLHDQVGTTDAARAVYANLMRQG